LGFPKKPRFLRGQKDCSFWRFCSHPWDYSWWTLSTTFSLFWERKTTGFSSFGTDSKSDCPNCLGSIFILSKRC